MVKFVNSKDNEKLFVALEPASTYKISLNWTTSELCSDSAKICSQNAKLVWLQSQTCYLSLMCSLMNGNVCSLAGIEMNTYNKSQSICLENFNYQDVLETHDILNLTFWQHPMAIYNMECYFWCQDSLVSNN